MRLTVTLLLQPMLLSSGPGMVVRHTSSNAVTGFLELDVEWGRLGHNWGLLLWQINLGHCLTSFPTSCMALSKEYKDSLIHIFKNCVYYLLVLYIYSFIHSLIHSWNKYSSCTCYGSGKYLLWVMYRTCNIKQDKIMTVLTHLKFRLIGKTNTNLLIVSLTTFISDYRKKNTGW